MAGTTTYLLWEDDDFVVKTPDNPHIPYSEGLHLIVTTKQQLDSAWQDPGMAGRCFALASRVSAIITQTGLAPWVNIQANGNWGLLPGAETFFHLHIYGRNKTESWGKPVVLPELPGTYMNDPMPEDDRNRLSDMLHQELR